MVYWLESLNVQLVRIMHFTDTYLPRRDGVITSLRTLRAGLADAGHTSITVVPAHREQAGEPGLVRIPALPCGVADLRLARWPVRPLKEGLLARLKLEQPDLIHVHSPGPAGLLGVLTAHRLGVPLVQTYHTDLHAYADAYRVPAIALQILTRLYSRRLGPVNPVWSNPRTSSSTARGRVLDEGNRLLLGGADAVIVPTAAVLERINLPVDPQRLYLVPTGVAPPKSAAPGFADRWGIDEGDKVVLFVGRVNREKGIELLIPAFERVLQAEPRAKLVLIGAVYEPRWLRRMISTDRIVVTGQQPPDEVAAAYQLADVFAFPSGTDTQALVLQEAALAGVPSVLVDPVLHERGALAGAAVLASKETFADAILGLLKDPAAAKALGAKAKANAARHTPQAFAAAMLDIYRKFVPDSKASNAFAQLDRTAGSAALL